MKEANVTDKTIMEKHWVVNKIDNGCKTIEFKQVVTDDYHSYIAQHHYIAKRDCTDDMFIYAGIDGIGFPSIYGIHVVDGKFTIDSESHYWFIEEADDTDFLRFTAALEKEGYKIIFTKEPKNMTKLKITATTHASPSLALIAEERKRQISDEGFSVASDVAVNKSGELALAAACYAIPAASVMSDRFDVLEQIWPWGQEWWKPTPNDRKREIIKSCALLVAEFDRLDVEEKLSAEKK
jgi:hypothetical protein